MIERQVVGGEPATVAYIKGDFEPASPDDYDMVKITFDSGRTVWARPTHKTRPTPPPQTPRNGAALDFEEAKVHRGGNPDNTGEFSEGSGGGAKSEGGEKTEATAPGPSPAAAPSGEKATRPSREELVGVDLSVSGKDSTQNVRDLDDLYERAMADEKQSVENLKRIAAAVGGEAMFMPMAASNGGNSTLKNKERAFQKMNKDYGGDPNQLKDIIRGTIKCDTTEQYRAAAKMFIDQFGGSVVRAKDRMINPAEGGYRDILINYRTPSGLIAEVQFNSPNMMYLKEFGEGHRLFEQIRNIPDPPQTEKQRRLRAALSARSERLYMIAYQKDGNTNWKTGEHHFGAGDTEIVEDAIIGDDEMSDDKIKLGQYPDEWWKLTPPGGKPFYFRMVYGDKCYSTATGKWQEEKRFHTADLVNPQFNMNDWDVERLPGPPADAPV